MSHIIGQVVDRPVRLHKGASIFSDKGGMIPLWKKVGIKRIHLIKVGVEEWAELDGEYEGWFGASLYPNDLYRNTGGRFGDVIRRIDIPPKDVWLVETKSEYEMHHMSRPEYNQWDPVKQKLKIPFDKIDEGLPGTVPLTPPPRQPLYVRLDQVRYKIDIGGGKFKTEDLNAFWKRALKIMAPWLTDAEIEIVYRGLTKPNRAFTNFDRNRYQILSCVGQTHQLISPVPFPKYGDEFYMIRTIAVLQDFNPVEILADLMEKREKSRYFFGAINSTKRRNPDGSTIDENFHHLGGGYVPVPLMSNYGVSWLSSRWVKRVYKEETA